MTRSTWPGSGPRGMIFVPSVGGISHAPKEFTRPQDVVNGANVLLQAILALDDGGVDLGDVRLIKSRRCSTARRNGAGDAAELLRRIGAEQVRAAVHGMHRLAIAGVSWIDRRRCGGSPQRGDGRPRYAGLPRDRAWTAAL